MNTIDISQINPGTALAIVVLTITGVTEWAKSIWRAIRMGIAGDDGWADQAEKAFIITLAALTGYVIIPAFSSVISGLTIQQLHIIGMLLGFNATGVVTLAFNWGKSSKASTPAPVKETNDEPELLG